MMPTAAFHARQSQHAEPQARASRARTDGVAASFLPLLYSRTAVRQSFTPVHHYINPRQDFYPALTIPPSGLGFALPIKWIMRIEPLGGTQRMAKRSIYKKV